MRLSKDFKFNPLAPPPGVNPKQWYQTFVDTFCRTIRYVKTFFSIRASALHITSPVICRYYKSFYIRSLFRIPNSVSHSTRRSLHVLRILSPMECAGEYGTFILGRSKLVAQPKSPVPATVFDSSGSARFAWVSWLLLLKNQEHLRENRDPSGRLTGHSPLTITGPARRRGVTPLSDPSLTS